MKRFNLDRAALESYDDGPPNVRFRYAEIGPAIGATHLAGSLYEIDPGRDAFPYHWEAGQEEWLFVLAGRVTVRTPEGEQELGPGAIAAFPAGPSGAHKVSVLGDEVARFVMVSDRRTPNGVVYPDSDKVSVRLTEDAPAERFRRETAVGYWDREP